MGLKASDLGEVGRSEQLSHQTHQLLDLIEFFKVGRRFNVQPQNVRPCDSSKEAFRSSVFPSLKRQFPNENGATMRGNHFQPPQAHPAPKSAHFVRFGPSGRPFRLKPTVSPKSPEPARNPASALELAQLIHTPPECQSGHPPTWGAHSSLLTTFLPATGSPPATHFFTMPPAMPAGARATLFASPPGREPLRHAIP